MHNYIDGFTCTSITLLGHDECADIAVFYGSGSTNAILYDSYRSFLFLG